MSTLAEFIIVSDADNRPPMLDKPMYESWKSRMELYIQGKDHGRIILNSVENGPLIWPTVEQEDGIVWLKTYDELSDKEKLQADCDLKATNIFLQGLPPDVYSLVNHTKFPKRYGTELSYLCKAHHCQSKNVRFAYVNYDQLYAYLEQHEAHANEARLMRERFPNPLALVANYHQPLSHFNNYHSQLPLLNSGLVDLTFLPGDDPIACMNKTMSFFSVVFSPCYPSTNNELRSSSNPRNQTTVQDGTITIQQVQGRQGQNVVSLGSQGNASGLRGNTSGQVKVVKCYNCQREGHMARQYTQPKRRRDAAWFKEKVLLVQAQAEGKELDEEQLAFLADPGVADGQVAQTITDNAAFQTNDLDTHNSDCDDISYAKAVRMANISSYESNVLSEVPYSNTFQNDMMNQSVQELQYYE
ncbi:alpha/beta hydrolases superfamily protein [Tanacetum coccineum]